jgi:hypothetical protein
MAKKKKTTLKYTYYHDINGTLEIKYPRGCSISMAGSRYYGYELVIAPKKGVRKPKVKHA